MAVDRASLSKVVSDQIRGQILDGRLKPGERLVEDRLSARARRVARAGARGAARPFDGRAGAARAPPRRHRRRGNARAGGRAGRGAHPPRSAERPARGAAATIRRSWPLLQDTLGRGNAAAQSGTAEQLARLNAEFHERLAEASRNSVLSDIMRGLRERTGLAFAINGRARAREDWKEHAGILAAVIDGRRGARGPAGHPPRSERRGGFRAGARRGGSGGRLARNKKRDARNPGHPAIGCQSRQKETVWQRRTYL